MSSPRAFLLALLLTMLQFTLSVDAKGGGRGSSFKGSGFKGSKTSKKKPNTQTRPVVFEEGGKCYDAKHVEMKCPAKKKTGLIVGIIIAVIAAILILIFAIWFIKRRLQKKGRRGLDFNSKELDDASSDHDSIVPLAYGEKREKDSEYDYTDKSAKV